MSESSPRLLDLVPELHLSIISNLRLPDKRRLRLVSRIFNDLLILDVPLEDLRAAKKAKTILLTENAEKGLGFEPFIILGVRKTRADSDERTPPCEPSDGTATQTDTTERILLDIYYPKFMPHEVDEREEMAWDIMLLGPAALRRRPPPKEKDDEVTWDISIHMSKLRLDCKKNLESNAKRLVKGVDYDLLRGQLVNASAAMLRSRFVCPECKDIRKVCPGCGGFSSRYPDLFTGCGWPMPCPLCIGYGMADYAKDIQDDDKELDKLWKEINEMLEKDIWDIAMKHKAVLAEDTRELIMAHREETKSVQVSGEK
ncbi:hypothetical protein DFH06DRAFT_1199142 [Mycena polygramma]|nr:hypothetical protein DFH06DRAFT_1199142 [Mycena polygramma]